ncbi:hypothetical protein ACXX9E_29770 [Pseudomonas sp. GNP014]
MKVRSLREGQGEQSASEEQGATQTLRGVEIEAAVAEVAAIEKSTVSTERPAGLGTSVRRSRVDQVFLNVDLLRDTVRRVGAVSPGSSAGHQLVDQFSVTKCTAADVAVACLKRPAHECVTLYSATTRVEDQQADLVVVMNGAAEMRTTPDKNHEVWG